MLHTIKLDPTMAEQEFYEVLDTVRNEICACENIHQHLLRRVEKEFFDKVLPAIREYGSEVEYIIKRIDDKVHVDHRLLTPPKSYDDMLWREYYEYVYCPN
ncbi:hypothetical protein [Oleidesulfovibrio alaskensis]